MVQLIFKYPAAQPAGWSFRSPRRIVEARNLDDVLPALLAVERETNDGAWAAGFMTYEASPVFDAAMVAHPAGRLPLVWFGIFDAPAEMAHETLVREPVTPAPPLTWTGTLHAGEYAENVARIHEAILDGATYQTNYTTRLTAPLPRDFDASGLFASMRRAQGAGYHALLDLDDIVIVSASPELFFARRGQRITTRPMKGTSPRGRWPAEDAAFRRMLCASAKERAENLMIVDLLRNDLGRIARIGSVRVPRIFDVEQYRTVLQMTSTIEADLRDDVRLADIFRALFPCGSVTGAPKIATMRIIAALEDAPREVYCGAIGVIQPGGDCTFSVPIRTVWADRTEGIAVYGVGSGITADATADAEARELEAKAAVLHTTVSTFSLLETMRVEQGRIPRIDRHLARLRASCAYFDRPFPEDALRLAIGDAAAARAAGVHRLRITLDERGTFRLDMEALTGVVIDERPSRESPPRMPATALAGRPVDDADALLFHKTTRRDVHEAAVRTNPGAFDVLLHNEHGHVTEFTRGNVVVRIEGRLCTPPVESGVLAGCMRAEMLDEGVITERIITVDALRSADRMWFVNSLRGWIEVQLPQLPPQSTPGASRA
jgi:para-aminobenzoate synthetase/4-amino-4-deoxychorismate lyase